MDGSGLGLVSDPSLLSSSPLSKEGEKRSRDDDSDEERADGTKRRKFRALEAVLRAEVPHSPGVRTCNLDFSNKKEAQAVLHPCNKEEASQITVEAACMLSDELGQFPGSQCCLKQDGACLSADHVSSEIFAANEHCDDPTKKIRGWDKKAKVVEKEEAHSMKSMELRLDRNAVHGSSVVDDNPFYPYKKLGQVKVAEVSECGSTTGPMEESEPLRKWKEMKQNGFLSLSGGSVTIPKPRGRQSRKRKDEELKKKSVHAEKEQANRFMKIAAPSGLLSGLNPGIINHVRNSKQVYSIIEAMVRSEKQDNQNHQNVIGQMGQRSRVGDQRIEKTLACGSRSNHFDLCNSNTSVPQRLEHRAQANDAHISGHIFNRGMYATSRFMSEDNDGTKLKLLAPATMASENTGGPSAYGHAANQEDITSLSLKAANVASHWLGLLQEDIKGRLAALKRSRKRVRNVINTELPYILSSEFLFDQENKPSLAHSSAGSSEKVVSEMHMARWRSLFNEMDKALTEEGRHLENWLSQVQEMQLNCEKGLKYVGSDELLSLGSIGEFSKLKRSEAFERECAVKAAAASIYSTCNFVTTTENPPCF